MGIEHLRRPKRFVTGHDGAGKAVFLSGGEAPQFHSLPGPSVSGVELIELWATNAVPAAITPVEPAEPNDRPLRIPPPDNGAIFRIVDFHPGHIEKSPSREDGRPAGFHRTQTIDYGVLIEGELHLRLDDDTVVMRPGDVVIQRGTAHAWENRSSEIARIAFVLLDGRFSPELDQAFSSDHDIQASAQRLIET